jgi:hypothetical protein
MFDPDRGKRIFSLTSVSRPALASTQPPIQWVQAGPFLGGKARPGRDADHSPLSGAKVVNEYDLYLLTPLRLHRCVVGLLYVF